MTPVPTPGGPRGARTASARRAAAVLAVSLALLVAACGSTGPGTPTPSATAATAPPSGEPSPTDEPTDAPSKTPPDEASEPPTVPPTAEPSLEPTGTPAPSGTPGVAAPCSGNDRNRDFFARVARAVTWDVYCAVLPAGWFVDAGEFRLAGGGRMEIAYKGPGGRRIEVREGAYCAGDDGCIPSGPDAGTASFGGRPARLVDVGAGAWLVVAEGGDINWEAKGTAMDGAALAALTAAFARVGE